MHRTTTIYVSLIDENVPVLRPITAEQIAEDLYLIPPQPYDREIETWEFEPGDRVICELVTTSGGHQVLAAVRLAPTGR